MVEGGTHWSEPTWYQYPTLKAIARKCESYLWKCHLVEDPFGSDKTTVLTLFIDEPLYGLRIKDGPHAQLALEAPFESYKLIVQTGYQAMWSPALGVIECEVLPSVVFDVSWDTMRPNQRHRVTQRILGRLGLPVRVVSRGNEEFEPKPGESVREYNERQHALFLSYREALREAEEGALDPTMRVSLEVGNGAVVSLGPSSDAWAVWRGQYGDIENPQEGGDKAVVWRTLTLKVEGVKLPDEAQTSEILERLGDAALFEIERASGVGLELMQSTPTPPELISGEQAVPAMPKRLTAEYDPKPLSLYRYGRSAWGAGRPLLAFLAFYQVLEYYFPAYSPSKHVEALRRKLREIAGAVSESDVDGVLGAIGTSKRRLFPAERNQLMSTIQRCVAPAELNGFLVGNEDRARFYGSERALALSTHEIPMGAAGGKQGDHRNKVAERVYEIRNRIVHTKSQHDDLEPLLPFDQEVRLLEHDLALVRFLAQKVLAASAQSLGSPP